MAIRYSSDYEMSMEFTSINLIIAMRIHRDAFKNKQF